MSNVSSDIPKAQEEPPAAVRQKEVEANWSAGAAIVLTTASFVLSNAGGGIVVNIVPQLLGWSTERIEIWLQEAVSSQFLFILTVEALTLGMLWWFMRRQSGTLAMLGLGRRPHLRDLGYAVLGFFFYFALFIAVATLLQQVLPIDADQKQELGFDTYGQSTGALALIFTSLVILPPITEEILFRGFLFAGLRRSAGVIVAVLTTSVLFGALHLLGAVSGEGLLWIAAIDTFVLSLVLCHLRLSTGALWAPILVHSFKNGLAFVTIFILHANG